jgi:GR25 family glycosyltransferase involved in LPS biosynthesis
MLVTIYINLDAAADRRAALEANFAAMAPASWPLVRASAISEQDVQADGHRGQLRAGEKACYLSHLAAVRSAAGAPQPLWIREDDTEIGARSCGVLDGFLRAHPDDWDILFTDLTIGNPATMTELLLARRTVANGEVIALSLSELGPFAGALSYVVRPAFAARLYDALNVEELDVPYDLALRDFILKSQTRSLSPIRAYVLFPFISTAAATSARSSVQTSDGNGLHDLWAEFRRLVWMERDLQAVDDRLTAWLSTRTDAESRIFGSLMEGLVLPSVEREAPGLPLKRATN